MTESKLWKTVVKPALKNAGFHCLRVETSTCLGFPDVVAYRNSAAYAFELKIGGKIDDKRVYPMYRPGQLMQLDKMRNAGVFTYTVLYMYNRVHWLPAMESYEIDRLPFLSVTPF